MKHLSFLAAIIVLFAGGAGAPAFAQQVSVALPPAFAGQIACTYSADTGVTCPLAKNIPLVASGSTWGVKWSGTVDPGSTSYAGPVAILMRPDLTITGDLSKITGSTDILAFNCTTTFTNVTAGPVTTMGGCQSGLYVGTGNTGVTFNGLRGHVVHMENDSSDTITLLKGVEVILTNNAGTIPNFRAYDCPTVTSGVPGGGSVTQAWCLYNPDAGAKIETAGLVRAADVDVTGSTIPPNGIYLGAANQPCLASSTAQRFCWNSAGFSSTAGSGPRLTSNLNASATAPTVIPNQTDTKAGLGADAAGDVSIIANNAGTATEMVRVTGTKVTVPSGLVTTPHTVSGLPGSPVDGQRDFVTDATACTFAATPTGGGSTHCPVYYDGGATAWKEG